MTPLQRYLHDEDGRATAAGAHELLCALPYIFKAAGDDRPIDYTNLCDAIRSDGLAKKNWAPYYGLGVAVLLGLLGRTIELWCKESGYAPTPYLQAYVVNRGTGQPGHGIDPFIRRRFPKLVGKPTDEIEFRDHYISFMQQDARRYPDWAEFVRDLEQRASWSGPAVTVLAAVDDKPISESPSLPANASSDDAAETEFEAIRQRVYARPSLVDWPEDTSPDPERQLDFPLLDGRNVDLIVWNRSNYFLISVATSQASDLDIDRALFRCVGHKAVFAAEIKSNNLKTITVTPVLVVGRRLSKQVAEHAHELDVHCKIVKPRY